MTTLAICAPQPDAGTITCAGLTRISSLLAGSMIWVKSTAAKLVATGGSGGRRPALARLAESGALLESSKSRNRSARYDPLHRLGGDLCDQFVITVVMQDGDTFSFGH